MIQSSTTLNKRQRSNQSHLARLDTHGVITSCGLAEGRQAGTQQAHPDSMPQQISLAGEGSTMARNQLKA
jgi:hypothetical protein